MKAKVIRTFKDKNTKTVHKAGKEIKVSKERFEEINSTALGIFLEKIEDKPQE